MNMPTYGDMIDYFKEYEHDSEKLLSKVKEDYPNLYIGRKDRFYETVKRIIAPTQLSQSPLEMVATAQ